MERAEWGWVRVLGWQSGDLGFTANKPLHPQPVIPVNGKTGVVHHSVSQLARQMGMGIPITDIPAQSQQAIS
jgi:hypothetical protein